MGETIHFGVETKEYNSCTGNRDIYMPITVFYPIQHTRFNHLRANLKIGKPLMISGFLHIIKSTTIMVEATDIDYLRQEINYNVTKNPYQTTPHALINLNKIADEVSTTSSTQRKDEMNTE
ncbi:14572_t:CDS:1, partial [Racocetra fulgida]